MGLRVRTNVSSLNAQRHLGSSTFEVNRQAERLASGYRINKAADDAAGLAISETLKADIRSLGQARRNANDAVSMMQVAEGSLEEIGGIMIRLRELSVQAASDTIGPRERNYLNEEFMQLKDEVDRIALSTEFNGTRLLTGTRELPQELMDNTNVQPFEFQVDKDYHLALDSLQNKNPIDQIRWDLSGFNAMTEGEGSLGIGSTANPEGLTVMTKARAQVSINTIDNAMQRVSGYRAQLGAVQNRIQSTDRNLAVRIENLSAAQSRIRDADFAEVMAEYTQQQILQKAGASVLSQANQSSSIALQLLGQ